MKGFYLEGVRYDYIIYEFGELFNKIFFLKVLIIWMVFGEIKNFKVYLYYLCLLYKISDRRGILFIIGYFINFVMEVKLFFLRL